MSKKITVLRSGDRRVVVLRETRVSGRKVDRRVLATDIDAELGLTICVFGVGSARWPDGPPQSGVAQGFNLIPVSGVGEAVGGVSEALRNEKIGGNGLEGIFNKDVTNDEMTFEAHKQTNRQALFQNGYSHLACADVRSEKKCACVRTVKCLSVHCLSVSCNRALKHTGRDLTGPEPLDCRKGCVQRTRRATPTQDAVTIGGGTHLRAPSS